MHPRGLAVRLALIVVFLSALGVIGFLPRRQRAVAWAVVIAALVVPLLPFSSEGQWRHISWIPFFSGPFKPLDILGNAVLYLPFGFFFYDSAEGDVTATQCAGWAGMLSCTTELSQIFGQGRFPSATDVVMNLAGAVVGFVFAASRLRSNPTCGQTEL